MSSPASSPSRRSLVLVAGSGRSGTSVFSGILQRLGFHVPTPEVTPDATNPRGFAESQWVVDFHQAMLTASRVQTSDARPVAWAEAARVADEPRARELRKFLKKQFVDADHVLIKDPRLIWFLPLWRRCATEIGVTPRFVTLLRHPAAVIDSKTRYYGGMGEVGQTCGWVNVMLHAERATRGELREFVRYDDLLDDWTKVIHQLGETLQLDAINKASSGQISAADQFVDPALSRSAPGWETVPIPADIRAHADEVWSLLSALAVKESTAADHLDRRLDDERARYADFYTVAEAIAESSVRAGKPRSPGAEALGMHLIPDRYRRKIPVHWRRAVLALLGRSARG